MKSIENIKGSDGSGNAVTAVVQAPRAPSATTIVPNSVSGINPTGFYASMGTPHTFTDPITSETITVISEATAVDFRGHIDGANIEIDEIAPGYVDNGSEVGDIVIIRPTTEWSNNIAEVLETSHDDDGTLKDGIVNTQAIGDGAVTADKRAGGFAIVEISGASATATVNTLDFKPKSVEFYGLWSDSQSFAQSLHGVAVDGSPIKNYSNYIITSSTGLVSRTSSNTACIKLTNTSGVAQCVGSVTSFTNDGFVVSFSVTQSQTFYCIARG